MDFQFQDIVLLLFIINAGTAFGAGIYEARILLPLFFEKTDSGIIKVNIQSMVDIDMGRKFWSMVTTIPLTLLTITNCILAFRYSGEAHNIWLAASFIMLAERLFTFIYFIPTLIKLMRADTMEINTVSKIAKNWLNLNNLRNVLTLVGWVMLLLTLGIGLS